jgi:type II secretory pathway pseudopilin PulG
VEVLVVLAIFGILSVVGVYMLGNRQGAAVRSVLDEVEGALNNARAEAMATGRDVAIETWGTWTNGTPLVLAYGDFALTQNAGGDELPTQAKRLLANQGPDPAVPYSQTVTVPFHFLPNDPTQSRACVVVAGVDAGNWAAAMTATGSGAANVDITTKDPFLAGDPMVGMIVNANNLFQNGTTQAVISGSNQRFTTNFIIQIVGTSPDAGALPGSPMGLIVVLANGSSVYKFYNPGAREGDGQWRRL